VQSLLSLRAPAKQSRSSFVIASASEAISFVVKDRHVAIAPRDDKRTKQLLFLATRIFEFYFNY